MTIKSVGTFSNTDAINEVILWGGEEDRGQQPQGVNFWHHQVAINAGDNASGTISFLSRSNGSAVNEEVVSDGSQVVVDLSTGVRTVKVPGYSLESLSFSFSSLGGSEDVVITVASTVSACQ